MTIDRDTAKPPDTAADMAVGAPKADARSHDTHPAFGASEPRDETAFREWVGLPPDSLIMVPTFATAPPMRLPEKVWAMVVVALDIANDTDPDRTGAVALFAGQWVPEQPSADLHDGDLVVRLTHPTEPTDPLLGDHAVDVDMLLAYQGRWQRVGHWRGVNDHWPRMIAPTAAAVMGLHTDAAEAVAPCDTAPSTTAAPGMRRARRGVRALLDAGMVSAGDELVWNRPSCGARHTARIRTDGTLVLADGRMYENPSGATTALGGKHQNGWSAWRRVADGRSLGELRAELRAELHAHHER
ncbi:hypothetical protein ACIA8G_21790 [Lentzea sp. NPDC051213]|uniref:restriction system modified-DNA reader domain-containing protein n=1 Tax=Lentzea sp. NPDC051213 TaxID=3364126 RepID=UPI0037B8DAC9